MKFLNLLAISRKIMTLNKLTLISSQHSSSSKDVEDKKQSTKLHNKNRSRSRTKKELRTTINIRKEDKKEKNLKIN